MKWIAAFISILLFGCAGNGSQIDSQHQSFLEMTAPGITGCKVIQAKYTDLSKAPAQLLSDKESYLAPQKLVQVWVMGGCKNDEKVKIDIVADGRGGAVLMPIRY